MRPDSLNELIASLNSLPGITKKQAEKLGFHLIDKYKDTGIKISQNIIKAQSNVKTCLVCGFLTEEQECYICKNEGKDRNKSLLIVETPLDVIKFEKNNSINGFYHVLNGLVDVSKKVDFDDLNITSLKKRCNDFNEIIIALSPNLEGIVTANLIKKIIPHKKVTQLAHGIPIGAAMEYVDELTLKIALENRKEIK